MASTLFFEARQTVTKEVYLEVLRSKVIPRMNEVAEGASYTFQQDSAPAYKAKIVQNYLGQNEPNFWILDFGLPTPPTSTHVISTCGAASWVRPASHTTPPS